MRGLRSTILLLLVLGGLVGYIYFVDAKRGPADADAKPKVFVELSPDNIEEIQIRNGSGETSRGAAGRRELAARRAQ